MSIEENVRHPHTIIILIIIIVIVTHGIIIIVKWKVQRISIIIIIYRNVYTIVGNICT